MPVNVLRLAGLLTLLFGGVIGFVRARPYDDPDMRAFLMPPPGCAAPCFMGVQPGVTAVEDAVAILEANQWIADVSPSATFYDLTWSGQQPVFVDTESLNYFMNNADVVGQIRLRTRLRLGDVYSLLGMPDAGYWLLSGSGSGVFHSMIYSRLGIEVSGFAPCPTRRLDLWSMPVEVRLHIPSPRLLENLDLAAFDRLKDIC